MTPNPILKKLGLSDNDRVVIFHADDIGMCQASLSAYHELVEFGQMSAAATMVPCPWFPATASYCRENHERKPLDMGVHLTLTSEWENYRWGPISTSSPESGLIDETGYFHATTEMVHEHAHAAQVLIEVETQIKRALSAGIDITHIDSHMGSIFHPHFLSGYIQLAHKYRVPALIVRQDENEIKEIAHIMGLSPEAADSFSQQIKTLDDQGFPMLDHIYQLPLDEPDDRLEHAKSVLDDLQPGITYFIFHPAKDTPELRAVAPDWPARVADYRLFTDQAWREYVRQSGIHVIGYKQIRELMRQGE